MFVNLHTLPAGQHMYTLSLHFWGDVVEEVDVVASARANWHEVLLKARPEIVDLYGETGWTLVHVADQSNGEEMYRDETPFKGVQE